MRQPLSITAISRAFSRPRRLINTARRMLGPAQPDAIETGAQSRHRQLELVARSGHYEILVDHDTGEHSHNWSKGMFDLLGLSDDRAALSHDAYITCLVQERDRIRVRAFLENALQGGGQSWCEYAIVRPDGSWAKVYDWLQADLTTHGKRIVYGFRLDISDRHSAQEEEFTAAKRFQALIDQLPGMPYLVDLNNNRVSMYVSPKIEALLGFSAEEWAASAALRIRQLHAEDRQRVVRTIAEACANQGAYSLDYRIHHRNGAVLWLHDEGRVFINAHDKTSFLQGVALDITERKQAQSALDQSHQRLQKMIVGLDSLREQEQRRLAKDIHDDFGQLLAALKMDMGMLESQLPGGDYRLAQLVCSIQRLLDTMMTSVRRIIADLPPQDLDDNGLVAALRSLATSFAKRHQIACELALPDDELALNASVAAPIYRLVQEALNNVAKHAHATRVNIRLGCRDRQVVLDVSDNGTGFTDAALQKEGSFGVTGMRERISALGGDFAIDSTPGKGTNLRFAIPLETSAKSEHVQ